MPTLKYFDPTDGLYKKISVPVGQAPAPVSGVFGVAPLDIYGSADAYTSTAEQGDEIFKDRAGNLRTRPQLIPTTAVIDITAPASAYPPGMSIMCMSAADATAKGWPASGTVVTFRRSPADVVVAQTFYQNHTPQALPPLVQYRSGNAGNIPPWSSWTILSRDADSGWVSVTIQPTFALHTDPAKLRKVGNVVYARGAFANTGMSVNGTHTIATLPAGFFPTAGFYHPAGCSAGAITAQFVIGAGTSFDSIQIRPGATLSSSYYMNTTWMTD